MKILIGMTTLLLAYFVYGFYLSQSTFEVVPTDLHDRSTPGDSYDYRGVMNVHTNLSTGSSDPSEVIEEAKKSDLDFLILTDVNQYPKNDALNSYNGNLLVINAGEYSFLDSRVLSIAEPGPNSQNDSNLHFTDLLSQSNPREREELAILAHPFKDGPSWTGSFPSGIDGLEVLNPKAISSRAWKRSPLDVFWSVIIYPFNAQFAFLRLFREPNDELALWDQIGQERPLLGFGGADASARAIPLADYLLKFPSYQTSFQIVNNHVLLDSELTGKYSKDREKIVTAMKRGHFYFSLDILGNPKGFSARLVDGEKRFPMGSILKFKKGLRLIADFPVEPRYYYEIVALQNGDRYETTNTQRLEAEIQAPGMYRVIVRVSPRLPLPDGTRWFTWVYTNPFFILP